MRISKEVQITQGKVALVDDDDYTLVNSYKWQLTQAGYAKTDIYIPSTTRGAKDHRTNIISMHRLIMGDPKGMDIDHINHNTLDNRKSNLRVVTHAQNMANMKTHKDNKVGIKGVYVHKSGTKKLFRSRIMFHGVIIDLGCYETTAEASEAYNDMARQLNGELTYQ